MSATLLNEVRHGFYLDSVALMRLSREIAGVAGVTEAALMMATPANRQILDEAGLLAQAGAAARVNDLVIAVRAESAAAARDALAQALHRLETPREAAGPTRARRPRSLRAALEVLPRANLALISVPGEFAAAEAHKALRRGLHVMIFSDNVALEDERALKQAARERGLLVMGPDCGTAILNGVPLAFANAVPRGDIGIVGASGTGMQEISSLIARAGRGLSQAIGVGGRDLEREIGGITTLMALEALERDPDTRAIALVSKPPDPEVARSVVARAARVAKPVTLCFIGAEDTGVPDGIRFAPTLEAAAELVLDGAWPGSAFDARAVARSAGRAGGRGTRIAGLFSGGTLCAEAQLVLTRAGRCVVSNAPVPAARGLEGTEPAADRILDLGADEYTRGRPHPMIDPQVRDDALRAALADPTVGTVLLDLVIGYGAHPDPAGRLAAVLAARPADGPRLVASVTGTDQDPQIRSRQVQILEHAGVLVAPSNAQAAELALALSAATC